MVVVFGCGAVRHRFQQRLDGRQRCSKTALSVDLLIAHPRDRLMADANSGLTRFHCAVCGCDDFVPLACRSDGVSVIRCTGCEMGVIETIPSDLMAFVRGRLLRHMPTCRPGRRRARICGLCLYRRTWHWLGSGVSRVAPSERRTSISRRNASSGHLLAKLSSSY